MTIPAADLRFEHALKRLNGRLRKRPFLARCRGDERSGQDDPQTEAAINLTPAFWITARLALEQQAIVAVGKNLRSWPGDHQEHKQLSHLMKK